MKCFKCGKEMEREDGGSVMKGREFTVSQSAIPPTQADINYYTMQLGKYADGKGECRFAICLECYFDGMLK